MNLIGHVSKFRWLWRQVVAPVWQGPSLEFFQMVPANVIHLVAFWWNNEARNIFWCFQTLTATLHCIKHFIQNCIKCTTHKKRQKHEGQNNFLCMKNTRPLSWYSRTQNPTEMKKKWSLVIHPGTHIFGCAEIVHPVKFYMYVWRRIQWCRGGSKLFDTQRQVQSRPIKVRDFHQNKSW